jgi:beta-mannosidase
MQAVYLAANGTLTGSIMPVSYIKGLDPSNTLIRYRLLEGEQELANQIQYLAKPKELNLQNPELQLRKLNEHSVEIRCSYLAKDVCITLPGALPSDNYFDLVPGEKKIIQLDFQSKVDHAKLKAKSLWDTLQN